MPTEAKNEKKRVEDDQDRGVVGHSGEGGVGSWLVLLPAIFNFQERSPEWNLKISSQSHIRDMVAIVGAYHAYSFEKEQQCTLFNKYIQSIQAMPLSKQFIL